MQQKAHSEKLKHTKRNNKIQEKDVIKVSLQQPLNQLMLTNLTKLQWNYKTFFSPFDGWQKCWHVRTSKYEPVVGNDDEMFSTAGYDLLLSQAAAVRQREDERETDVRGDGVLVLLSVLNCTHPPPFISARSASTSSAPSIATSSCVGGNVKTNNL